MKGYGGWVILILICIGLANLQIGVNKHWVSNYKKIVSKCPQCDAKLAYALGQKYVDTEDQAYEEAYYQNKKTCENFVSNLDSIGFWERTVPDTTWWRSPPTFRKKKH